VNWQRWATFLQRRRFTVAAVLGAATVLGIASARNIGIVHDPFALFTSDSPDVAYVQEFWDTFGQDANFMLLLLQPAAGNIYAPDYLAAHRWRYARVVTPLGRECLWLDELNVGLAGDWCPGGDAEGAFLSGAALAGQLLASRGG